MQRLCFLALFPLVLTVTGVRVADIFTSRPGTPLRQARDLVPKQE